VSSKLIILDYGIGNTLSIKNAFKFLGYETIITKKKSELLNAKALIFPGVGAFGHGMSKLKEFGLDEQIINIYKKGVPILGICLGMQLFYERSNEFGNHQGLKILNGEVIKLEKKDLIKLPNIGWRKVFSSKKNLQKENSIFDKEYYFVHSFHVICKNDLYIIGKSNYYNLEINSIVQKENLYGCQFHPEKSGKAGLNLLQNFINIYKL
jgi:imidazole glycerol-phosphate synthase subunit HisH